VQHDTALPISEPFRSQPQQREDVNPEQ